MRYLLRRLVRTVDLPRVRVARNRIIDIAVLYIADRIPGVVERIRHSEDWRWLRERDAARDHGDALAGAIVDFLTTSLADRRDQALWEAIEQYCDKERWAGGPFKTIIELKRKGELGIV